MHIKINGLRLFIFVISINMMGSSPSIKEQKQSSVKIGQLSDLSSNSNAYSSVSSKKKTFIESKLQCDLDKITFGYEIDWSKAMPLIVQAVEKDNYDPNQIFCADRGLNMSTKDVHEATAYNKSKRKYGSALFMAIKRCTYFPEHIKKSDMDVEVATQSFEFAQVLLKYNANACQQNNNACWNYNDGFTLYEAKPLLYANTAPMAKLLLQHGATIEPFKMHPRQLWHSILNQQKDPLLIPLYVSQGLNPNDCDSMMRILVEKEIKRSRQQEMDKKLGHNRYYYPNAIYQNFRYSDLSEYVEPFIQAGCPLDMATVQLVEQEAEKCGASIQYGSLQIKDPAPGRIIWIRRLLKEETDKRRKKIKETLHEVTPLPEALQHIVCKLYEPMYQELADELKVTKKSSENDRGK